MSAQPLCRRARIAVLVTAFLGLVFDGVELGLMPVASLSVSKSLLGEAFTPTLGGDWFARFTAALMLGAAVGGILLGSLGDRIGRARAMGVSILFYSIFATMGAWVKTQEQMLVLRFLVGLGVGGLWPNGIALVSECWSGASRPVVSGVMMAGLNAGILALSQLRGSGLSRRIRGAGCSSLRDCPLCSVWWCSSRCRSRRSGSPSRAATKKPAPPLRELFRPGLIRITLTGIILSCIPMIGAWAASKWMIPWADKVAGAADVGYKAATQGWWALGATLGSFTGAQLAAWLGRRWSYFLTSLGTTALTIAMFQLTAPMQPGFHAIVFAQGFVATLFFGWLALYLPEIFPVHVRATGSGLAYNSGRFGTAIGVLLAGMLFTALGGDYPRVGTICALIYALGIVAIWWAPDTTGKSLDG